MMMTKEMMRNEEKGWRSVGLKEEEEARERWNLTEKGNVFSKGRRWPYIKGEGAKMYPEVGQNTTLK